MSWVMFGMWVFDCNSCFQGYLLGNLVGVYECVGLGGGLLGCHLWGFFKGSNNMVYLLYAFNACFTSNCSFHEVNCMSMLTVALKWVGI